MVQVRYTDLKVMILSSTTSLMVSILMKLWILGAVTLEQQL